MNKTKFTYPVFSGLLFGSLLTSILAFKPTKYEPSYATAEVSKIDGFYVFTDAKPVMPYDSVGEIDLGFISDTQYESIRKNLLKRAKKKYPKADGIILNLKKKGMDKGRVIKFK